MQTVLNIDILLYGKRHCDSKPVRCSRDQEQATESLIMRGMERILVAVYGEPEQHWTDV